ncbi:MAG TPA: oligosaccharide flippase family protein [Steroidobacteraceae bacterium]|jgi:O-antigen/teichoic acid export membrane protein
MTLRHSGAPPPASAPSFSRFVLARNGVFAALTVAVTALSLFAVYRFTNHVLGLRALGTWSVTFGLMSLTGLADLGLSLAMVREVARLRVMGDWRNLPRLVAVAAGYTFTATLLAGIAGIPAVQWIVESVVLKGTGGLSRAFVLACALATSLTSVSAALAGALEGMERYDLKFVALLVGNATLVATTYLIVGERGIEGIALSFAAQAAVGALISAAALSSLLRRRPQSAGDGPAPDRLRSRLATAVRIGLPLRVAGLASFVFEPVTRLLVGSFGGPASAGIYEAASRLCIQGHTLISSALQVIVPRLSALTASDPASSQRMFQAASRLTARGALLGFCALSLSAVTVSFLLLSRLDGDFVYIVLVLAAAWMLHVLAAPTYFANIADGSLGWNWLSQWIAVIVNAVVAPLAALAFGWRGVVAGPFAGLAAATIAAILARYRRTHDTVLSVPWKETAVLLAFAGALAGIQLFAVAHSGQTKLMWVSGATLLAFCVAGALAALRTVRQLALPA